jgi:hypothetical protein
MLNSIVQSQVSQGKAAATARVNKIATKTQVKYAIVFVLLLGAVAAFGFFNFEVPMYFFYFVQAFALLIGILHLWQMGKRFGWKNQYSFYQKLNLSVIILLVAMVVQAVILSFCNSLKGLFIIFPFSLLTFLFPLLAVSTYEFAIAIPKSIYKTWKYSTNVKLPDMDLIDFSNSYIVTFELKKTVDDFNYTFMKFKAPLERLTFGELFYLYVNEYNDKHRESKIQYLDSNNLPLQWIFYKKPSKWWESKKYIDPSLTIRENKIKENFLIVSERVSNKVD